MDDPFLAVAGTVVLVTCLAGIVAAVSRGSHRKQRRQRAGAGSAGPAWYTPSSCPPLPLHEVRIVDVSARDGRILLTVIEVTGDVWVRESLVVAGGVGPGVIAQLDGWCAAGASLMLFTDDRDDWQLLAPDGTTTGLRVFEASA